MEDKDLFSQEPATHENTPSPPDLPAAELMQVAQEQMDVMRKFAGSMFSGSSADRAEMIHGVRESMKGIQQRGKEALEHATREKRRREIAQELCNGDVEEADRIIADGGPSFGQKVRMFRWRLTHFREVRDDDWYP